MLKMIDIKKNVLKKRKLVIKLFFSLKYDLGNWWHLLVSILVGNIKKRCYKIIPRGVILSNIPQSWENQFSKGNKQISLKL